MQQLCLTEKKCIKIQLRKVSWINWTIIMRIVSVNIYFFVALYLNQLIGIVPLDKDTLREGEPD